MTDRVPGCRGDVIRRGDPAEDALHAGWTRATAAFGLGGEYADFDGDAGGAVFPEPARRRLAAVKCSFDPATVFHDNVNISPDHDG